MGATKYLIGAAVLGGGYYAYSKLSGMKKVGDNLETTYKMDFSLKGITITDIKATNPTSGSLTIAPPRVKVFIPVNDTGLSSQLFDSGYVPPTERNKIKINPRSHTMLPDIFLEFDVEKLKELSKIRLNNNGDIQIEQHIEVPVQVLNGWKTITQRDVMTFNGGIVEQIKSMDIKDIGKKILDIINPARSAKVENPVNGIPKTLL